MSALQLLNDLKTMTQEHIQYAENLLQQSDAKLNFRVSEDSWSVLECLEHLNRYGNFYIPEVNRRIISSKTPFSADFKPGILGNYFAESMLPKEKLNTMKTFKSMNPINSQLDKKVVQEFIRQQKEWVELLEKAKNVAIHKVKTHISISKLIRLKLGDTFRFVIYHNHRHILQSQKVLKNSSH